MKPVRMPWIVAQPNFPVPPTNDGAQAIVIYDTILAVSRLKFIVLSLGRGGVEYPQDAENASFLHFDSNSFFNRALVKIVTCLKGVRYIKSKRYFSLLTLIFLLRIWLRPSVLVVHSTKMSWLLEIKRWFPSIRLIGYHHSSEDHTCSQDVLRMIVEKVDGHFFVSEYGRKEFSDAAFILTGTRINSWTIQNGVNHSQFKYYPEDSVLWRLQYGLKSGKVTILYAGRVIPRKGFHILLDALERIPVSVLDSIQLLIAGGADYFDEQLTPYRRDVGQKLSSIRGKIHVVELGYVPHKFVHKVYACADIYVFTSIEPEGSPLGLLEAASMGIPVIAHNLGGIAEIVQLDKTGLLIDPPFSADGLSTALQLLIADENKRVSLGKAAYALSREAFSSVRMARDFESAISDFIQRAENN